MGQFKPMVKMFTDEPSVILKLKKGGKVASKAAGQSEGFKSMANNSGKIFEGAENGVAPKKPSMAERRKAMNLNQYAKGGKVANKQMGGTMPMQGAPASAMPIMPAAPAAMGRAALAGAPVRPMGRSALAGMAPADRSSRAAMVRKALTGMKKGGSTDGCAALEKELKHHEAMSASKAHGKASGGAIDKAATKTTIEGNAGKFAKTKMHDGDKADKAHGTGGVKMGGKGGYAMGGSIMGNEKAYANTKMVTSKADRAHGTGGVKMGNKGGFAAGGSTNWENRPADTAKPGVTNTSTGGVRNGNAGGFKKGGEAKKAYATGGNVVSDGKAEKMPRHFVSKPVANSLQSGTFKKGGQVAKFSKAGPVDVKDITDKASRELEEALNPLSMIKEGAGKVRDWFREKTAPEGSVTKTVKSTTVVPENKKRGGSAKC